MKNFPTHPSAIPPVIQGAWQLSKGHTPGQNRTDEDIFSQLDAYREVGIASLDFGDIYLGVEETLGRYLAHLRKQFGDAALDTLRLHTKYVPDLDTLISHTPDDVRRIVNRSRERLGVQTLDLVQFHWWNYDVPRYLSALRDLFHLKAAGVIRNVGVTNFNTAHVQEFIREGLTPFSIQLQYSVLDQRPKKGMIELCRRHNIHIFCYGTVAGGFLSEKYLGAPEPKEPYENRSLVKYKLIIDETLGWEKFQELLALLKEIADRSKCDIATVASAYILQKPGISSVIVGVKNTEHLENHTRLASMKLPEVDIALLDEFLSTVPVIQGDVYDAERNDVRHAGIMQKGNNSP